MDIHRVSKNDDKRVQRFPQSVVMLTSRYLPISWRNRGSSNSKDLKASKFLKNIEQKLTFFFNSLDFMQIKLWIYNMNDSKNVYYYYFCRVLRVNVVNIFILWRKRFIFWIKFHSAVRFEEIFSTISYYRVYFRLIWYNLRCLLPIIAVISEIRDGSNRPIGALHSAVSFCWNLCTVLSSGKLPFSQATASTADGGKEARSTASDSSLRFRIPLILSRPSWLSFSALIYRNPLINYSAVRNPSLYLMSEFLGRPLF